MDRSISKCPGGLSEEEGNKTASQTFVLSQHAPRKVFALNRVSCYPLVLHARHIYIYIYIYIVTRMGDYRRGLDL
jgi:hypothetical protein